jgi:hypothetical protein
MTPQDFTETTFLRFLRSRIYSRWFYAFLASICTMDAVADTLDILRPGKNFTLDVLSLVASALAALLTATLFLDLLLRRTRT